MRRQQDYHWSSRIKLRVKARACRKDGWTHRSVWSMHQQQDCHSHNTCSYKRVDTTWQSIIHRLFYKSLKWPCWPSHCTHSINVTIRIRPAGTSAPCTIQIKHMCYQWMAQRMLAHSWQIQAETTQYLLMGPNLPKRKRRQHNERPIWPW